MKRIIALICAVALMLTIIVLCCSCGNMDMFDTNYTYDRAIVEFPGGEVKPSRLSSGQTTKMANRYR